VLLKYIREHYPNGEIVVVSPDAGGVERARAFAKRLGASLAIVDKRREKANVSQVMNVIGDVKGKMALLLDDMIDTAGTIVQAAEALAERGAKKVAAACTHAVLSGPAVDRINSSEALQEVIVTNTIPLDSRKEKCSKLTVLSVAYLFAEAIKRIHEETSISSLFV
jgi:ribose-phosphate pyrophosphokinase